MLETMKQVLVDGFINLWVEGKRQGLYERNRLPAEVPERVDTEIHEVGWRFVWYRGRSVTRSVGEWSVMS